MQITRISLDPPYLIYLGDVPDMHHAKTGAGVAYWRPERCIGQMRLPACPVDLNLPDMTVQDARDAGVKTVIVGVAPKGGQIPQHWIPQLAELASAGLDIAAGLHTKLSDTPELVTAASKSGAKLIDVRMPPADIPVADGRPRTGKRVLMVGTDCAVGKKYSALALHRELHRRDIKATFRATGQTGILIAGEGMPIDAVVADFISGAAEILSPDNDDDHWDVIEGQGSLLNPSYAGVSLGLLHGSQPDAIILCHDAQRIETEGVVGDFPIPELDEVIDDTLRMARRTNAKCFCAGVSVNTSCMSDFDRDNYLSKLQSALGLPCVDPLAIGMSPIANFLLKYAS
jgi:D-glutamate N-acetyltransferase